MCNASMGSLARSDFAIQSTRAVADRWRSRIASNSHRAENDHRICDASLTAAQFVVPRVRDHAKAFIDLHPRQRRFVISFGQSGSRPIERRGLSLTRYIGQAITGLKSNLVAGVQASGFPTFGCNLLGYGRVSLVVGCRANTLISHLSADNDSAFLARNAINGLAFTTTVVDFRLERQLPS
ncbi:hypothetical protein AB1N83_009854 [Pleurotus pulmonarius]